MQQGLRWIGWIGWALASVALSFLAGRTIATVWAIFSWPLTAGPRSLYPESSVRNGEALAAYWMTWNGLAWTTALLVVCACALAFGVVRLLSKPNPRRRSVAVLALVFVIGMTTYCAHQMIRSDPYWDVFIVVPT
jgi:multisubunit Na+/H+ antiporter MnhF subunit